MIANASKEMPTNQALVPVLTCQGEGFSRCDGMLRAWVTETEEEMSQKTNVTPDVVERELTPPLSDLLFLKFHDSLHDPWVAVSNVNCTFGMQNTLS